MSVRRGLMGMFVGCGVGLAATPMHGCGEPCGLRTFVRLDLGDSGTQRTLRGVAKTYEGAVAVGDRGTILRYEDGRGWSEVLSPSAADLHAVAAWDESLILVAVGDGGAIYYTVDRGKTWVPKHSGTSAALRGVVFAREEVVIAVGDAAVLRSADHGSTWAAAEVEGMVGELQAVGVVSGGLLAVGDGGAALKSDDLGLTWRSIDLGTRADLRGVDDVQVVGADTLLEYTKQTWKDQGAIDEDALFAVSAGWVVGAAGHVELLADRFAEVEGTRTGRALYAVSGSAGERGYSHREAFAVGEHGVVLKATYDSQELGDCSAH